MDNPDFEPEVVKKASKAAFGLVSWVRAMEAYDRYAACLLHPTTVVHNCSMMSLLMTATDDALVSYHTTCVLTCLVLYSCMV